uniref:Uncharacterized protein n=1 Tax=Vespula pensylvanica TaxID=30213 RepID=A0A834NKA7_VESPE|nr:hypothetical protein H0235_013235 [Vespula pensylvanica]
MHNWLSMGRRPDIPRTIAQSSHTYPTNVKSISLKLYNENRPVSKSFAKDDARKWKERKERRAAQRRMKDVLEYEERHTHWKRR